MKAQSVANWFVQGVTLLLILFGVVGHLRRPTLILMWCLLVAIPFFVAGIWVQHMNRRS